MKLTKAELASKGHAFDYGYEAQRAVRLFQEGIGHTPDDDLALALGYPLLVELAPDVDGDLVELAKARINQPLRRLVPWPRNLAVRAVRGIAFGWDEFPETLCAEALEAIARDDDFEEGEEVQLLGTLFEVDAAGWEHIYELFFLLEALAGGAKIIAATCDIIEADDAEWKVIENSRLIVVRAIGGMFDRLSAAHAAKLRPRLEALFERYKEEDAEANDPELIGVPLRALDLVLNGARGYERSASTTEWGRDRTDAQFLDRAQFAALATPLAPPEPHMLPSAQWLVQGGPGDIKRVGDWRAYEFKGSKLEAHRFVVDQFARLHAPEATAFITEIATDPRSKPLVIEAVKRNIQGIRPNLEALARSTAADAPVRAAAAELLEKCLPS